MPRALHHCFKSRKGDPLLQTLTLILCGLCLSATATAAAPATDRVALTIDAGKPGAKIHRHIFGQFAEHLDFGIHHGVWVGRDSPIPNRRGIRNDVVATLRAIKVPNVRWPGGCFADNYHWRHGIRPKRAVTLNPDRGNVTEPNTFGTHEFMDFAGQIGAAPFISINVGTGTAQEAAECTRASPAISIRSSRKAPTACCASPWDRVAASRASSSGPRP
jgi:alpha-N-arabinofuranosidase